MILIIITTNMGLFDIISKATRPFRNIVSRVSKPISKTISEITEPITKAVDFIEKPFKASVEKTIGTVHIIPTGVIERTKKDLTVLATPIIKGGPSKQQLIDAAEKGLEGALIGVAPELVGAELGFVITNASRVRTAVNLGRKANTFIRGRNSGRGGRSGRRGL